MKIISIFWEIMKLCINAKNFRQIASLRHKGSWKKIKKWGLPTRQDEEAPQERIDERTRG